MKQIIGFIIGLILLVTPVLADSVCLNANTIQNNLNVNGNTVSVTQTCVYGCDLDNNRCNPAPFDTLIFYVLGFVIFIIIIVILLLRIGR